MASEKIRNLAFLGASSAGKTSLVEALAHHLGKVDRLGSVEEGTTLCDFHEEEKDKKHSLMGSVVHISHGGGVLNFIDTPGYPDFQADAVTSLGAADIAVLTLAAEDSGLPFHAVHMWNLAGNLGLARAVVITHLDGDNLTMDGVMANLQEHLGQSVVPVTLGNGTGDSFNKVEEGLGVDSSHRSSLVDAIVESDDSLMEKYLEEGSVDDSSLMAAIPGAMAGGTFAPVFCVDPLRGLGVSEFADFMESNFPTSGRQAERRNFPNLDGSGKDGRVVARVWKVATDKHLGQITYLRILQGTLTSDGVIEGPDGGKPIKVNGLSSISGKDLEPMESAGPGHVVAVSRMEDFKVGDILVSEGTAEEDPFPLPLPFCSLSVRPKSRDDEQKIGSELQKIVKEDPCFKVRREPATHETIVDGLSDLHLSTCLHRLSMRGVDVDTSVPKIPYKETITAKSQGHHRHKKQSGGAGQFGECFIRLAPSVRGSGFVFVDKIVGASIPRQFIPAVEKGVAEQMTQGIIASSEVVDVQVELYDGKHHAVDSDENSFKMAGARALKDAFLKASPILLEPIMKVEISVPSRFFGDVSGNLNNRRGHILGMEMEGDFQIIQAEVPLVEMQTYSTPLRSMTHGEGNFKMEFGRYDRVPSHLQEEVVAQMGSEDAEE